MLLLERKAKMISRTLQYIYVCNVFLQNIFINSVFPLEYSRITFSLSFLGEIHFDKGVAVIVLSNSQGVKTSTIPTLPNLMGLELDPVINTKYDLGKLHPNTL